MKKITFACFILFFVLFGAYTEAAADDTTCKDAHNREVILQLRGEVSESFAESLERIPASSVLEDRYIYTYKVPDDLNIQNVLQALKDNPNVISAAANERRCVKNIATGADAPDQWYLQYMNLAEAWKIEQGSADVTVAVLDTGVNDDHLALSGRVLPGYNFVDDSELSADDHGHGTFVAGVIAAKGDGGGITGLTENVNILPVKVGNKKGDLETADAIAGIYYAIEQDADIINMSYTGDQDNELEMKALNAAYQNGITLVAAAGNKDSDDPHYPASYPKVISVGATKNAGSNTYDPLLFRAGFSNYGEFIDVAAPGVNIVGLGIRGWNRTDQGTSYSAPMVSGLASLLKSKHPEWEPAMIEWAIEKGATNGRFSSGLWEPMLGYGVIDYYESLKLNALDTSGDIPDDRTEAFPVEIEARVSETLQLPRDQDWYRFTIPEESLVTVKFSSPSKNEEVVDLYKEGRNAPLLQTEDELTSIELEAGTYQLKVYETAGHWSESPYVFRITAENLANRQMPDFTDVKPSHVHYDGVRWITAKGIRGYEDKTFGVGQTLRRSHAAVMFVKAQELEVLNPADVNRYFTDVDENAPYVYAEYIATVGKAEIFTGNKGRFMPDNHLTREQMATTLVNAFDLKYDGEHVSINLQHVSQIHRENVQVLADLGITNQLDDFRAYETVTRGQFASFLYRTAAAIF